MTTIGLLREGKVPADNRVALTPPNANGSIAPLPTSGLWSRLRRTAAITDKEYADAGVAVSADLSACDILLGIKEVPVADLIPGKTYLFFSHTRKQQPANREMFRHILEKKDHPRRL